MRVLLLATLCLLCSGNASAQAGKKFLDEGMRFMREGKPDKAESQFEKAIAAEPKVGLYHLWLGNAVGQQASTASKVKQPFMARRIRAEFEKAIELDSTLIDARDGLIQFYLQAPGFMGGSPAKAREQQREIAKLDVVRGHLSAATIAWHGRDTVATERALKAALTAAPDSVNTVIALAQRQAAWGRTSAAFETMNGFLARHPTDIAIRFQWGRLAALSGTELARGETVLRAMLAEPDWVVERSRPSKAAVHYRLGMILEKSGKKPEAKASYQTAVTLDPQMKLAKDALAALK
ncbi:MAG: tetratricopeptide repeat protein [Gemmatimonadaceae bacterium]